MKPKIKFFDEPGVVLAVVVLIFTLVMWGLGVFDSPVSP